MRRAVFRTTFARLHGTCELFDSADFDNDELPSLIKSLLDLFGDVDNLRNRNAFVPATNESIKDLYEIEGVSFFAINVEVFDLRSMLDRTFAAQ